MQTEAIREYQRKYRAAHREQRNAHNRKWYQQNKASARNYFLKQTYGITQKDYDELLQAQNGRCAICDQLPVKTTRRKTGTGPALETPLLYLDHDHNDGRIRGLLCPPCNTALGLLKEDIRLFKRAIEYLGLEE